MNEIISFAASSIWKFSDKSALAPKPGKSSVVTLKSLARFSANEAHIFLLSGKPWSKITARPEPNDSKEILLIQLTSKLIQAFHKLLSLSRQDQTHILCEVQSAHRVRQRDPESQAALPQQNNFCQP